MWCSKISGPRTVLLGDAAHAVTPVGSGLILVRVQVWCTGFGAPRSVAQEQCCWGMLRML